MGHRLVDVLRSGRHVGGVWLPVTNVSSVRLSVMLPCLWGRAAMSESECPGWNLRSNPWLWLCVIQALAVAGMLVVDIPLCLSDVACESRAATIDSRVSLLEEQRGARSRFVPSLFSSCW